MKQTLPPSIATRFYRIPLLFFVFLVLFSAVGCQKARTSINGGTFLDIPSKPLQDNVSGKNLKKIMTFRGLFVFGHEVRSFTLCGSKKELWVIDRTNGKIIAAHKRMTHEPYQPIFAEIRGFVADSQQDGFGADYDGTIVVNELVHASSIQDSWGCREKYGEFIFKAQGNEPGWTVFITPHEIRFTAINLEKPIVFPYSTPTESESHVIFKSSTNTNTIIVTLIRTQCSDTMNDELFGWKADVNLDESKYQGCAKKGDL